MAEWLLHPQLDRDTENLVDLPLGCVAREDPVRVITR